MESESFDIVHTAFDRGRTHSVRFRKEQLRSLLAGLEREEASLLSALSADLGRPPLEAYVSEIYLLKQEIRYALSHIDRWTRRRGVRTSLFDFPSRSWIDPVPLGVVLIIGPWNYPIQLSLTPLVSAIAAGNAALIKPSELAPHSAEELKRLIASTLDSDCFKVVLGDATVAARLVELSVDFIFFTGSTRVGTAVYESAAKRLIPVVLELGGKCPCVVAESQPSDRAVQRMVLGKLFNAGQTCVAPDYLCVPRGSGERIADRWAATVRAFYGEDYRLSPDYSRIISERHFDRLMKLLPRGARLLGTPDRNALKFPPTLVLSPGWEDPVMREEIFGPILPIVEYDSLFELYARFRSRPKPLAAYLFSNDRKVQNDFLLETVSGAVVINDVLRHVMAQTLPFGGVRESGLGQYHGEYGFNTFSRFRSVMFRGLSIDPFAIFPPYRNSFPFYRRILR